MAGIKKILVLGYFGYRTNQLDGQTVKTRDVFKLFKIEYPNSRIDYYDTQDFKFNRWSILRMVKKVCCCDYLIYMPANNNLKHIFPLLFILSKIFKFHIHYYVVGGWLCEFLDSLPLHRKLLKRIKGIHCETKRLAYGLENKFGFNNVDMFPNFRFFDFTPNQNSSDILRLVFMARIMKEKGLDWIFELADYIANHELESKISITFYGQISEKDRSYFYEKISKYDFVEYIGALEPDEIYQTISQYDCLLLPTHFFTEGLPGSIVDAYISGIPVIATEWLNAREFIDDSKTGFIIPFKNGQSALIDRVLRLQADKQLLSEMKSHALEKRKNFAPPKINLN